MDAQIEPRSTTRTRTMNAAIFGIFFTSLALTFLGFIGGLKGIHIGSICKDQSLRNIGIAACVLVWLPMFPGLGVVLGITAWVLSEIKTK